MALAVPFALTSCSDNDNDLTPSQQQDVELAALTEQYLNATVIPTYTLLANGTDTLYHKLDSLRTVAWAGGTITAEAINDVAVFKYIDGNSNTPKFLHMGNNRFYVSRKSIPTCT